MSTLNSVIPSVPVSDMDAALKFYTEKLGFKLSFINGKFYAILARDGVELGLCPVSYHKGIPGKNGMYLKVAGVDALYAEIVAKGVTVLHPLKTENYGMREFMIADLDGNTINYGEPC